MVDNYLTPEELRALASACESLIPLWNLLTNGPVAGIVFDEDGGAPSINCYGEGGDGDLLGVISWGGNGPVFYPESVTNS